MIKILLHQVSVLKLFLGVSTSLMEIPQPRLRLFSRGSSENISNRLLFIFLAKRNKKFLLTAKRKSSSKIFIFILDVAATFN